jgi:hypothetical protein
VVKTLCPVERLDPDAGLGRRNNSMTPISSWFWGTVFELRSNEPHTHRIRGPLHITANHRHTNNKKEREKERRRLVGNVVLITEKRKIGLLLGR